MAGDIVRLRATVKLQTLNRSPLQLMDELRKAVQALAEDARVIETQATAYDDPPSRTQLETLQKRVDRVQQSLNRQTAMDAWSEETQSV
jgi:hypothetical protein